MRLEVTKRNVEVFLFRIEQGTGYDGEGRRVQKVTGTATISYVYDAAGQLAAEYATQPSPSPCATCYLVADNLGSTRMMMDGGGLVQSLHDYLPFGEEIPATVGGRSGSYYPLSPLAINDGVTEKFTGKERDAETGLDFFGARYYSAAQGRWMIADPSANFDPDRQALNPQRWNQYAYVLNNPLNFIDRNGEAELRVVYDNVFFKEGGDRAWRDNNPGNLGYAPFTRSHGATGADYGGEAIFPTMQAGVDAQAAWWDKPGIQNKTLAEAITIYCPPSDNCKTAKYISEMAAALEVDPNILISSLTPAQLRYLIKKQRLKESKMKKGVIGFLPPPAFVGPLQPRSPTGFSDPFQTPEWLAFYLSAQQPPPPPAPQETPAQGPKQNCLVDRNGNCVP